MNTQPMFLILIVSYHFKTAHVYFNKLSTGILENMALNHFGNKFRL